MRGRRTALLDEDDAVAVVDTVNDDVAATAIEPSAPVLVPSLDSPRATVTVVVSNSIATETEAPTAALDPAASALVWVTNSAADVAVTDTSPVAVIASPVPRYAVVVSWVIKTPTPIPTDTPPPAAPFWASVMA